MAISLEELRHLHSLGFKLIPLSASHRPAIEHWTPIYEDPNYWQTHSLEQEYRRFRNVATCFGKVIVENQEYYLHCLDVDSEEAYDKLRELIEIWKTKTYVVKTRKAYGFHIYWLEGDRHEFRETENIVELKCDKTKGLTTLTGSTHRDQPDTVCYAAVGRTDKIAVMDGLYDSLVNDILPEYLSKSLEEEPSLSLDSVEEESKELTLEDLFPRRLKPSQIDKLAGLVAEHWTKGYRNDYGVGLIGAMVKVGIREGDCEPILRAIGEAAGDDEKEIKDTLNRMRSICKKAESTGNINRLAGRNMITDVIKAQEGEKNHKKVVKRVDDIFGILNSAEVIYYDEKTGEEIDADYIANHEVEEDEYGLQTHEAHIAVDENRKHEPTVVDEAHQIVLKECVRLFKDQRDECYALVNVKKRHKEPRKKLLALDTPQFHIWIIQIWNWYQKYEFHNIGVNAVMLPSGATQKIIDNLKSNEAFDSNVMTLDYRTGYPPNKKNPDCFFINLDNEKGEAYKITREGKVELVDNPPPIFISEPGALPQAYADFDYPKDIFNQFFKLINVKLDPLKQEIVTEEQKKLLLQTYIISLLWPDKRIHRAILNIIGPWGSVKTGLLKSIRFVVAPNDFDPPALPDGDERSRVHAIANQFLPYFDNLTSIDDATSDTFCRTSTGGAYLVRMLYTNNGVYVFRFTRSLAFTSLQQIAWKPDLVSRCLMIRLADVENYIAEADVENALEKIRPKLFGYVLNTLAKVFKYYKDNSNKFPATAPPGARLAGYVNLCEILSRTIGNPPNTFVEAYKKNMVQQVDSLVEGEFVAETLLKYVAKRVGGNYPLIDGIYCFKGSKSQLYRDLCDFIQEDGGNLEKLINSKQWPSSEVWLGRRLTQTEKTLKAKGVYIHELSREKITNVIQIGIEYRGTLEAKPPIVKTVNESINVGELPTSTDKLSSFANSIFQNTVKMPLAPKMGNQARNFGSEQHNSINSIFLKSIQLVKERQQMATGGSSNNTIKAIAEQVLRSPTDNNNMIQAVSQQQPTPRMQGEDDDDDEWKMAPMSEKGKYLLQKAFPYGAVAPDLEWRPNSLTGKQEIYCAAFQDVINESRAPVIYHIADFAHEQNPEKILIIRVLNELRKYGHCIFWGGTAEGSDLQMLYERCQELGIDCSDIIAKYEFEDGSEVEEEKEEEVE
jgi:hypothetical protein